MWKKLTFANNLTNKYAILAFLITFFSKFCLISYGSPYIFHPDENVILTDPLRLLVTYANFDFSQTTNLYNWIISFWIGFSYIIGKIVGYWDTFEQFKSAIITYDFHLIYLGRVLSLLFSSLSTYFFYLLFNKRLSNNIALLSALLLTFNPIEIFSDVWAKFDPVCLSYFAYLSLNYYAYHYEGKIALRSRLYILCFIGVALRIDFIAFLFAFSLTELIIHKNSFRIYFKSIIKSLAWGILLFSAITFYPIAILFNQFCQIGAINPLATQGTFEAVISESIISTKDELSLIQSLVLKIFHHLKFYVIRIFISLSPLILISFYCVKRFKQHLFWFVYILFFMGVLSINGHAGLHYLILISSALLILFVFAMENFNSLSTKVFIGSLLFYFLSLFIQTLYFSQNLRDNRILAKKYILNNYPDTALFALEKYSQNGAAPPIEESKEIMLLKAGIIKKQNSGTGEFFTKKANLSNAKDTRYILDIIGEDYFMKDSTYKGYFNCRYDTLVFAKRNPLIYVTPFDIQNPMDKLNVQEEFYTYILNHFELKKTFKTKFADPRLNYLYPFNAEVYIYERKI